MDLTQLMARLQQTPYQRVRNLEQFMTEFGKLIRTLGSEQVAFVLVGLTEEGYGCVSPQANTR